MKTKLSVSIMCANLINLEHDIRIYEKTGVDYIHLDVMDSTFVKNLTFGPDSSNAIKRATKIPMDIHLLVEHPSSIIRSFQISKGDIITVHAECKDSIMENMSFARQQEARFGIALNPDTTVEEISKYLPYVDVILLMLVVPGFAGGKMIDGIMEKVSSTRSYLDSHGFEHIEISVDGNINIERAKILKEKGASILVGGTAGIHIKGKDISKTIPEFKDAIK